MKTQQTSEIVEHFLTELQRPAKTLTEWEEEFLVSVRDRFDRRGSLSEKQFEILERIYAEKTA